MRSFWTFSVARARCRRVGVLSLLCVSVGLGAKAELARSELVNFALGPEYAQWLVGAVAKIARPVEVKAYLELDDDSRAAVFIEEFWQRRRDPEIPWPDQQPRAIFDRRSIEADRLYTEGIRLGRRTERGEIFVLYGAPTEVRFEVSEQTGRTLEIWEYEKKSERGLDGKRPRRRYYFTKSGERTMRQPVAGKTPTMPSLGA